MYSNNGHDLGAEPYAQDWKAASLAAKDAAATVARKRDALAEAQHQGDDAKVKRLAREFSDAAAADHMASREMSLAQHRLSFAQSELPTHQIEPAARLAMLGQDHPELVPVAVALMANGMDAALACICALHLGDEAREPEQAPPSPAA